MASNKMPYIIPKGNGGKTTHCRKPNITNIKANNHVMFILVLY